MNKKTKIIVGVALAAIAVFGYSKWNKKRKYEARKKKEIQDIVDAATHNAGSI